MYIIDTETADISGGVCELAILTVDRGTFKVENVNHSLLKPKVPISPSAMCVHHITPEMVELSPSIEDFAQCLELDSDRYIVCHNAEFDVRVLEKEGFDFKGMKVLCTLKLARELFPKSKFGDHKLGTLFYGSGVYKTFEYKGDSHRADYDCYMLLSVLKWMLEEYNLTIDQAYDLIQPKPAYKKPCYLKKYRGQGITWEELLEIDYSYMEWVANNFTWKEDDPEQVELRDWFGEKFGG